MSGFALLMFAIACADPSVRALSLSVFGTLTQLLAFLLQLSQIMESVLATMCFTCLRILNITNEEK